MRREPAAALPRIVSVMTDDNDLGRLRQRYPPGASRPLGNRQQRPRRQDHHGHQRRRHLSGVDNRHAGRSAQAGRARALAGLDASARAGAASTSRARAPSAGPGPRVLGRAALPRPGPPRLTSGTGLPTRCKIATALARSSAAARAAAAAVAGPARPDSTSAVSAHRAAAKRSTHTACRRAEAQPRLPGHRPIGHRPSPLRPLGASPTRERRNHGL
jgi:hypothetical protein